VFHCSWYTRLRHPITTVQNPWLSYFNFKWWIWVSASCNSSWNRWRYMLPPTQHQASKRAQVRGFVICLETSAWPEDNILWRNTRVSRQSTVSHSELCVCSAPTTLWRYSEDIMDRCNMYQSSRYPRTQSSPRTDSTNTHLSPASSYLYWRKQRQQWFSYGLY
jgi:hypothetical protein